MEAGEINIPLPPITAPCDRMEVLNYQVGRILRLRGPNAYTSLSLACLSQAAAQASQAS